MTEPTEYYELKARRRKNRRLRFAATTLPPVLAYWSETSLRAVDKRFSLAAVRLLFFSTVDSQVREF
jgi:hypothetical protein